MTGVLKVLLWIYGVVLVAIGLGNIIAPDWMAETAFGIDNLTNDGLFMSAMLGAIYIAAGFFIAAAGRDPLRYISWVKFAVLKIGISVVIVIYALIQEYIEPSGMVITMLAVDFAFGLAFLIFYPWKLRKNLPEVP